VVIAAGDLAGVDHQRRGDRVQGLDHPDPGDRPLDLLAERVGVGDREGGRHAPGEVERVGHVDQDLALQVGPAGLAEGVERARPGGGVDDQVGVGSRLGEAAQGDLGMPLMPCRERLLLHGTRLGAGQQGGDVAGAEHRVVAQRGQLGGQGLPDHATAENGDLHGGNLLCVVMAQLAFDGNGVTR
jgi:hypothetical protein